MRAIFDNEISEFLEKSRSFGNLDGLLIISSAEKDGKLALNMARIGRFLKSDKLSIDAFLLGHRKILEEYG